MSVSQFKNERTLTERIEKFISDKYFTNVNLFGKLFSKSCPVQLNGHHDFGFDRPDVSFAIDALNNNKTSSVKVGEAFGPTWTTHWFKISYNVPRDWHLNKDGQLCLIWDSSSEAMIWSEAGEALQGLSSDYNRTRFVLDDNCVGSTLYIEMACNEMFGAGEESQIAPPNGSKMFTLRTAEIRMLRKPVQELLIDFGVIFDMITHAPKESVSKFDLLYFANKLITECRLNFASEESSASTFIRLSDIHDKISNFFANRYSNPNDNSEWMFTIHAVANCHIDTAWLWPYAETKRKCARSWLSTLRLMDSFDDLNFACSQMQQLEWLKENYFDIFERVKVKVKECRFAIVGGVWVEMDGNIPSGESFIRQVLYGQQFCQREFGFTCTEFWLPDTFGYSPQLPQIMKLGGMRHFITQKLSWNLVNQFPHSSFWWEGIDGSKVLTHFPPANTYSSEVSVKEVFDSVRDFKDKGRSRDVMLMYGYGDGGGGPTEDMLMRMKRLKNMQICDANVTLKPSTPSRFFEALECDSDKLCTWTGELYLELHNATYTTHALVKKKNRQCEFLLRQAEFLSALEWLACGKSTSKCWSKEWKKVLLNQFHDVLPGTSISMVYDDAHRIYNEVINSCTDYFNTTPNVATGEEFHLNCLPWSVNSTAVMNVDALTIGKQVGFQSQTDVSSSAGVPQSRKRDNTIAIENKYFRVLVDEYGQVVDLVAKNGSVERSVVERPNKLNVYVVYDDVPLYWDAWDTMDYHLDTGLQQTSMNKCAIESTTSGSTCVINTMKIGTLSELTVRMTADERSPFLRFDVKVTWREAHKFLKVQFPLDLLTNEVTYECQFGHIKRATHRNTSWDSARFEVCGHKWIDMSEHGFGVALLNDSKYGFSCRGKLLEMSLLRAPKSPDPNADMGDHEFSYAIMPHFGSFIECSNLPCNVIEAAYVFNCSPITITRTPALYSLLGGSPLLEIIPRTSGLVVEAVKVSEDGKMLILRLYEAYGSKCSASVKFNKRICVIRSALCDMLENESGGGELVVKDSNLFDVIATPFQIITIKVDLVVRTPA